MTFRRFFLSRISLGERGSLIIRGNIVGLFHLFFLYSFEFFVEEEIENSSYNDDTSEYPYLLKRRSEDGFKDISCYQELQTEKEVCAELISDSIDINVMFILRKLQHHICSERFENSYKNNQNTQSSYNESACCQYFFNKYVEDFSMHKEKVIRDPVLLLFVFLRGVLQLFWLRVRLFVYLLEHQECYLL